MPFPIQIPPSWARIPVFRSLLAASLFLVRHLVVWLLFYLLTVGVVNAQEYSYIHYDAKDGLAGTVMYSMCQDKEGFIWFGTETGVSRFDGTHFKNFTVKDGLPDNTIIRVYADSKGRVWLVPFKHAICYYYKGRIYNQQKKRFVFYSRLKAGLGGPGHVILDDQLLCSLESYNKVHIQSSLHKLDYMYDAPPFSNILGKHCFPAFGIFFVYFQILSATDKSNGQQSSTHNGEECDFFHKKWLPGDNSTRLLSVTEYTSPLSFAPSV